MVIEAGNFGTVRIFFERKLSRHHKSYYHYWMAYRAEPVTRTRRTPMPTTRSGRSRGFPPALTKAELRALYERCPTEVKRLLWEIARLQALAQRARMWPTCCRRPSSTSSSWPRSRLRPRLRPTCMPCGPHSSGKPASWQAGSITWPGLRLRAAARAGTLRRRGQARGRAGGQAPPRRVDLHRAAEALRQRSGGIADVHDYAPVQAQLLRDVFGVEPPASVWKPETGATTRRRLCEPPGRQPRLRAGRLRHDPRTEIKRRNAEQEERTGAPPSSGLRHDERRAETVGSKASFSGPGRRAGLPSADDRLLRAELRARAQVGAVPDLDEGQAAFGVAGLWRDWPDGAFTFTMLTVNADHHPVMKRMHAPGKKKRGIVIVPRSQWDNWLTCRDREVARSFWRYHRRKI